MFEPDPVKQKFLTHLPSVCFEINICFTDPQDFLKDWKSKKCMTILKKKDLTTFKKIWFYVLRVMRDMEVE